jgi:hypothetical protein
LHGHALSRRALGAEAIGVGLRLHGSPPLVQRGTVERETLRQAEQGEIVVVELHSRFS